MIGYIYKTTNLINNKVYIGKHKSTIYDKNYFGSGRFILEDIAKYGIHNFSNEIIYEATSIDDLNNHEKMYIAEYRNCLGPNMVYNISNGGDGGRYIYKSSR